MRQYTMNMHEKILGYKSTGQTEDHVPWICLPQGDLPAVHSRYTQRSSTLPEGPLGGLPSLSLTTEGSWIHLGGRVAKSLVSPLTPVPPSDYRQGRWSVHLITLARSSYARV